MVKPAAFYVPVNLDGEYLFPEAEERDRVHYFLNAIHWRFCNRKVNREGFVQLNAHILRKTIGRDYWPDIGQRLLFLGIIESDYKTDLGKSTGYRLAQGYRETQRLVCTNVLLNQNIQNADTANRGPQIPLHRWLESQLSRISFDLDKAASLISDLKAGSRKLGLRDYRQTQLEAAKRLANGDMWFRCDTYGRVHTPITALKRELRSCITASGEPLVAIDLVNSQPLFLGMLARKWLMMSAQMRNRTTKLTEKERVYDSRWLKQDSALPTPKDLVRFLHHCESGTFYESLMTEKEQGLGGSWRKKFKRRFFAVLFGKRRGNKRWRNVVRERFAQKYPTVWEVLGELKSRDYRRSSHLLQNLEATLFISKICGRLMKERPGIFVVTIHDCLITTRDASGYVEQVLREEIKKYDMECRVDVKEIGR